jgi:hypothetical protein
MLGAAPEESAATAVASAEATAVAAATTPPPPAAAAAPTWRSTGLPKLRQLTVEDFQQPSHVPDVIRLVGCCSGLTKLTLELVCLAPSAKDTDTAAAVAAGAALLPPGRPLGFPLRHLEVVGGGPSWAVNMWMGCVNAAALTTLRLENDAASSMDMSLLAACSDLQQLQLARIHPWSCRPFPAFGQQLSHLRALTQLMVRGEDDTAGLVGPVPAAVWQLTQLRHLDVSYLWQMEALPDAISSMRHLTQLTIQNSGIAELPHQLGAWLPQLQVLEMGSYARWWGHALSAIPLGLSRLTHLDVTRCSISSVSAVEHLVQLKRLCIRGNPLEPPFAALAKLTALEHLEFGMYKGSGSDEDSQGSDSG